VECEDETYAQRQDIGKQYCRGVEEQVSLTGLDATCALESAGL